MDMSGDGAGGGEGAARGGGPRGRDAWAQLEGHIVNVSTSMFT